MTDEKVQRKLVAILHADVAGYSRLTGSDELGTHRKLSDRLDVITKSIETHDGRVVNFAGDAILAEFGSVVDALAAAVESQRTITGQNADEPEDSRLEFRMGINLGEVIVDRDDIFGDGVNVAARLETLARPGGICISGIVQRQVAGKLNIGFEDMGPQSVKNIAEPIDAFHVLPDPSDAGVVRTAPPATSKRRSAWAPIAAGAGALLVTGAAVGIWQFATTPGQSVAPPASPPAVQPVASAKPSIAVLPFTNLSESEEYGHLADGIVEDVITQLSQIPGLSVISRNSTFIFKGKTVSSKEVSETLGARYVLEGSFRKAGDQVRVSARLIDAPTNLTLWAEKLDRKLNDVFMLQDEITRAIVGKLSQRLASAERLRGSRKRTNNIEAYDYVLQARRLDRPGTGGADQAKRLLEKAIELDPEYSQAYASLAWINAKDARRGPVEDRGAALRTALENAEKAYELNKDDYFSYWTLGVVHSHMRNTEKAAEFFQKALDLNPNAAEIYTFMVRIHLRREDPRAAVEAARTAIRLNPVHPPRYEAVLGMALIGAGRLDEAKVEFEKAIKRDARSPMAYVSLAAIQARQGLNDEARRTVATIKEKFPRIGDSAVPRVLSYLSQNERTFYRKALRDAGLPAGQPPGATKKR